MEVGRRERIVSVEVMKSVYAVNRCQNTFQRPRRDEDDGRTYFFQPGQKADELDHIAKTLLGPNDNCFALRGLSLPFWECGDLGSRDGSAP